MTLQVLKDDEIESVLSNPEVPVLLDFTASWCGPCKALTPILEKLSEEYQGRLKVYKVDVDEASAAAEKYGIRGVPTLIAFDKTGKLGQVVGMVPRDKILKLFGM